MEVILTIPLKEKTELVVMGGWVIDYFLQQIPTKSGLYRHATDEFFHCIKILD